MGEHYYQHILNVLEKENRWLAFDELFNRIQPDCDWTAFAMQLEHLVEQGKVQYILPYGADTGSYRIRE